MTENESKVWAAVRDLVLNGRHPYYEPSYYIDVLAPSSPDAEGTPPTVGVFPLPVRHSG